MEIQSGQITSKEPEIPKEEPGQKKGKGKDKKAALPKRKYTQFEILQQLGLSDDIIPSFQNSEKWLEFFPPRGI